MNIFKRRTVRRATPVAALMSVCAVVPNVAFAAEPGTEPEITISARRPTNKVVGRTSSGIPIRQYELSYSVGYADLDLATNAGADELKRRVSEAAKSACKDLDKLYPEIDPDRACVSKAVDSSMTQVDRAVKSART